MKSRSSSLWITTLAAAALCACGGGGSSGSSTGTCYGSPTSGGGVLQSFTPPCDPGGGNILVTASGEVLALGGYAFPPASPDDVAFVDGWEIQFSKLLVTFDHVKLSSNPDLSPTDESQTGGVVAQADGPWAVDLHKGGPLPGAGGSGEQSVPIVAIKGSFDPAQRYAFGFDAVAATASAKNVNLDTSAGSTDLTDYQEMITNGWTVLYVGTATWRGDAQGVTCTNTNATYDFSTIPKVVNFRIGFASPTTYVNCQNPRNNGAPFPGEEHQRGIAVQSNTSTIAQATFHTDHPFWDSFVHDSPAHFDQVAAQYAGVSGTPTATMDGMVGVDFTAFKDKLGKALPWRSCLSSFTPGTGQQMHFDNLSVPFVLNGSDPAAALRDYRDYMTYNQSTFGHLNADGLCFVKRNYPSPH